MCSESLGEEKKWVHYGVTSTDVVDTAEAEMCGQVIYPAAVLNISAHPEAAQAFLDYLRDEEATEVFEAVGFSAVPAPEEEAAA